MTHDPLLPSPLQPRHDGWTPARQWVFLQALADTASVTLAARSAGMSVASAHRLRRHPAAGAFRAAWEAALAQNWGRLEQVALERAVNGEVEQIERDGFLVGERRRPCSDRLLIHLLKARERQVANAASEREAARRARAAEARLAKLVGRAAVGAAAADDGDTGDTAALRDFLSLTQALPDSRGWEGPASHEACESLAVPLLPQPPALLAPADARLAGRARPTKVRAEVPESGGK